ncbi:MAG: cytochrome c oxidase accessory protein CcoG [Sorangiineae bacterium PRO1]|nr:cytochrome c oxidase accessory protein CcoG [Sorangiineae bacterium PRO1]
MSGPLPAPERVLPTLNADGTRRLIHPKLQPGRYWRARLLTGWGLIALFVALPFVNMNGKPVMLLDVPARQFHLFGSTFLATDGVLLMLLLLSIFVLIIWLTALLGRGWCGWACPQTVYMEFLFRPIERLFEGDRAKQIALDKRQGPSLRRIAKNLVFALLSVLVANVFLAYFVGVERLSRWVTQSPLEHPTGFLVMAVTAGLVMLDFAWFREQMCTVACPYARLQSVLLDERSLVVAYDGARGEPRSKGKPKPGSGDCIDCNACVVTCPTGIDIREGLQLECIACTQCMDACDSIMDRIGKPRGLIRYSSQEAMETRKRPRYFRPRVLIYPVVLAGFVTALLVVASRIGGADVTILRGIGAPFVEQPDGIQNQIRVKIENRTSDKQRYQILILDAPDAKLIAPENPLPVRAGSHESTSVFVIAPRESFHDGQRPVRIQITDEAGFQKEVSYKLLGPREPSAGGGS